MKIRKATKKDIPKILVLAERFLEEYQTIMKIKAKDSVARATKGKKKIFEKDLSSGNGAIFLAEEGGKQLGYVFVLTFFPWAEKFKKHSPGFISDLYVKKEYRKKGVGIKLIKEAEKWLKSKGKKDIALDVGTYNRSAINLYNKLKYKDKTIRMWRKLR